MIGSRKSVVISGDKFRDAQSLAFDGTDDHIETGVKPVDTADATYVWWSKSSQTGDNRSVFSHGDFKIGGFAMNHSTTNLPILQLSGSLFQYWADVPTQDDGNWHHWAVVVDIDDMTACKLYIDGILQTQGARGTSGAATSYGTLRIARGDDEYWTGSMSEFAVYDTMLSHSQVQTLYNGRDPYNHKEGILSGNLKGWWRMGDGTLDTTTSITEGGVISDESQDSYLSGDLIDSTDILNTGNWTAFGTNTIALDGDAIKITGDGSNSNGGYSYLRDAKGLNSNLTVGKVYKMSFKSKVNTGSSVATEIKNSGGFIAQGPTITSDSYIDVSIYFVCTHATSHYLYSKSMGSGEIIFFKDFELKEVVGGTGVCVNMASNQFSGDTP